MIAPACPTPGCILTAGHALSKPNRPCLVPPRGEPPHRRIGRPKPVKR